MRELTKIQSYIFGAGAVMMVVGVGCMVFGFMPYLTSIIFTVGAVTFSLLQMSQKYTGTNITILRLRNIMIAADICFILSALLQLEYVYKVLAPHFMTDIDRWNFYIQYIYNNWVVPLLVGAVLELYSINRISYELKKS